MTWTERKTVVYDIDKLPFSNDGEIEVNDPSTVCVNMHGLLHPMDIGSWCYTLRKKIHPKNGFSTLIKPESFRNHRLQFVSRYLEYINNHQLTGKSSKSLKSYASQFSTFVKWCDIHNPGYLDHRKTISIALELFTNHLLQDVKTNIININTAATKQLVVITALKRMYGDTQGKLFEGIQKIHRSYAASNVTSPPSDEKARTYYQLYKCIFSQFTDFLICNKPYPVKILLPDSEQWIFPTIAFSKKDNKPQEIKKKYPIAYNSHEGRINTEEEIFKLLPKDKYILPNGKCIKKRNATVALKSAKHLLDLANNDLYHPQRIRNAKLAQLCFIMLFSANTGMSLSQISELTWSGNDYEIFNERIGFKGIKQRANGREVSFIVTSSFIPLFNKYLRLRKYLLESYLQPKTNHLFFKITSGEIRELGMSTSHQFRMMLYYQFGIDAYITTREWRAYKSDYLVKTTSIANTALMLQNSTQTVIKHYIEGSDSQANNELTSYFDTFTTKIIDENQKSQSISTGQCTSINNPLPKHNQTPFAPNCEKPEGCLFCKNYAIHADVIDLKKILSFKYVIEQTRYLTSSDDQYHKLFDPVLSQIKNAVDNIKKTKLISSKSYKKIKYDIYENEQLDMFWGRKLQLLVDLELI